MITKFPDFVIVVQKILNNCALQKHMPFNDTNIPFDFGKMSQGSWFVVKKSARYHYYLGLDYIRGELTKNNIEVSETYTNKSYLNFLEGLLRNGANLKISCENFISKLKTLQPQMYKLLIPIIHYDYHKELDSGDLRIVTLTDELLENEFDNIEMPNATEMLSCNNTDTYAVVSVKSLEIEQAKKTGHQLVERFIYATRLVDYNSSIRLGGCATTAVTETILIKQDNCTLPHFHAHDAEGSTLDAQFYARIQPYWDKLVRFLYSDNLTELQKVILSSLYWYGEADVHTDSRIKLYSNLIIGLERIVLSTYTKRFDKAINFGQNCAKIFKNPRSSELWKNYYEKRNTILHETLVEIYEEDIGTLRFRLRGLLLQLIDLTAKYENMEELLNKEFGIEALSKNSPKTR